MVSNAVKLALLVAVLFFSFSESFRLPKTSSALGRDLQSINSKNTLSSSISSTEFSASKSSITETASSVIMKSSKAFKVFIYISLWYLISIFYNIYNKKALNLLKLPWFVATTQMGMGLFIVLPLWITTLRELPAQSLADVNVIARSLSNVALYQTLTHIAGVISLGAGAVSFVQVIKASEPAFTAFIAAVFEKDIFPLPVYLTLIPVIAGVSMASATELSFSWYCLFTGVMANVFASARGVFGKKQMCGDTRCVESMSPENYYAVLTILSFLMLIPVTLLVEGPQILSMISNESSRDGLFYTLASGLMFYLYNEVSFKALNDIHPVSHALANTVKRIAIILSSYLVFRNEIKPLGMIGAAVAVMGVFAYSLAQYYTKKKKTA